MMTELKLEHWPTSRLIPYARNPRKNDHAVEQMAGAIREFGFRIPLIVKSTGEICDGHLRYKAAQHLGLEQVPVILADDLTETQIKAFRIADREEMALFDLLIGTLNVCNTPRHNDPRQQQGGNPHQDIINF